MRPSKTIESTRAIFQDCNLRIDLDNDERLMIIYLKSKEIARHGILDAGFLSGCLADNAYIISALNEYGLSLTKILLTKYLKEILKEFVHILPPKPKPPEPTAEERRERHERIKPAIAHLKATLASDQPHGVTV